MGFINWSKQNKSTSHIHVTPKNMDLRRRNTVTQQVKLCMKMGTKFIVKFKHTCRQASSELQPSAPLSFGQNKAE